MNIIKKKFAYLFAMGVFVLGISSSIPVFAASSSNSIIHKREYMTLWVKTDGGNLNVREDDCRPRAQSVRSRDVVSNRDIEETVDEEQARQLI